MIGAGGSIMSEVVQDTRASVRQRVREWVETHKNSEQIECFETNIYRLLMHFNGNPKFQDVDLNQVYLALRENHNDAFDARCQIERGNHMFEYVRYRYNN